MGRIARHRPGRLANRLRRTGALLHEGGMGPRHFWFSGSPPVRPAALQAVSVAAHAHKVFWCTTRPRRAQAWMASLPGSLGDFVAAVQRPRGLRSLWILHLLRL